MIDVEVEYKKVLMLQKKWAKHWLTPSAHRAHSSTLCMEAPAAKTLELIESIDIKNKSYKEKFELLDKYFYEQNQNERNSKSMGSSYYLDCIRFNKKAISSIEKGEPVIIPRLSRK